MTSDFNFFSADIVQMSRRKKIQDFNLTQSDIIGENKNTCFPELTRFAPLLLYVKGVVTHFMSINEGYPGGDGTPPQPPPPL